VNAYLPGLITVGVMLAIVAVAGAIAVPLRRRADLDRAGIRSVLAHVARPLLVLVVTPGVVWLAARAGADAWFEAHAEYVIAWNVFWLGVVALLLVEAALHQVFALRKRSYPVPDLLGDIIRALLILALAFFVLKVELGWDIGPLLASTALITAVVGFALQGVLGNLLAGMSLHLTRSVKQGDWIEVDGVTGRVTRTNWRETRLQTLNHHQIIVPNSKLSEGVLRNLNHPTPGRGHRVDVGASYSDAPDAVIAALEAAAREVPEVLDNPPPRAMVTTFEDYGINYALFYYSNQYHRRVWIDGQVSRHIWYKFKRSGIEIPFPMSDKLLNDFMTVVYNQRKLAADEVDTGSIITDLMASDFHRELMTDDAGQPLLSREDYARVAPRVQRQPWTHGETVLSQGEPGDTFYVVAGGELAGRIDHGEGGPETTFTVGPGAVVGEMSLLTGAPRGATLTTATACDLLAFDRDAFVALLALREEIPERLATLAAAREAENLAAADAARRAEAEAAGADTARAGILGRLLGFLGR